MKLRTICKSKIHHATVTAADVDYIGSIGIDQKLMEMVDIIPGEQVSVWNVNNGMRIETYAIPWQRVRGKSCSTAPPRATSFRVTASSSQPSRSPTSRCSRR